MSSEYVIQFQTGAGDSWVASTNYYVGQYAVAGGSRLYHCTTSGRSGSVAPTGTGNSVTDGTVVWDYIGVIPVINIAGTVEWNSSTPTFTIGNIYRIALLPLGNSNYFGTCLELVSV